MGREARRPLSSLARLQREVVRCDRCPRLRGHCEKVAREKNYKETIRKFGHPAAERIERSPMYPPTAEQVAALVKDGPRPQKEINEIFVNLLRKRGLLYVADIVASHPPAS